MDSLGPPPWFDGTGFQRWKILMQAHLQATSLNVWRVVSDDMKKNGGQQEKQHDVTAKCTILYSLSDNVFNHVYSCENAKELWKMIIENHEGTEDVANERYHVLIDKLKWWGRKGCKKLLKWWKRANEPQPLQASKEDEQLLEEINSMGYMVFLKDGPHHQLMKVEKKFKKNKQKKEKKPQAWIICHIWWMGKRWWRIKCKFKWWIKQEIHHPHGIIIQHLLYGQRYG